MGRPPAGRRGVSRRRLSGHGPMRSRVPCLLRHVRPALLVDRAPSVPEAAADPPGQANQCVSCNGFRLSKSEGERAAFVAPVSRRLAASPLLPSRGGTHGVTRRLPCGNGELVYTLGAVARKGENEDFSFSSQFNPLARIAHNRKGQIRKKMAVFCSAHCPPPPTIRRGDNSTTPAPKAQRKPVSFRGFPLSHETLLGTRCLFRRRVVE